MKTLISIVGTTGIGKTKLAIDLAKHFRTEIISCDSRQFFQEMKIGTAAPSLEELSEVPHHFIGNLSVLDYYSIGQFETDALSKLNKLFQENDTVVMVGGSMMYEKAVIEGLNDLPEINFENQEKLNTVWHEIGYDELLSILENLDFEYFNVVDKNNPRRILRAIDVIWQTGEKYSKLISEPKNKRDFNVIRIGIEAPREIIYERINKRVDVMMGNGLLNEVQKLQKFRTTKEGKELTSLRTVGYNEIFNYLDGLWTLDFAVTEIKKNSRRFAKRQLTWYRGEENIHWVNFENSFSESLYLLAGNNLNLK